MPMYLLYIGVIFCLNFKFVNCIFLHFDHNGESGLLTALQGRSK